ncbi:MAG: phage tail tape measure protein [Lactobacillaceae bacterium]|jgi:phage-related minor tail protein|nr:phage tail tape measure protein [Lactobacillaceae bacterium]
MKETANEGEAAATGLAKSFGQAGQQSAGVLVKGMAVAGAAVGAFAVSSVKSAGDFEQTMNLVGQATGAPKKELKSLSDMALDWGKSTKFNAAEVGGVAGDNVCYGYT